MVTPWSHRMYFAPGVTQYFWNPVTAGHNIAENTQLKLQAVYTGDFKSHL